MSIMQFGSLPKVSAQHYYKDQTMKSLLVSKEKIVMKADINFDCIKTKLSEDMSETEKEDFCQQVVYQHVNWFHMLSSDLDNIARHRELIFPPGMPNDIPKFFPEISVNTEKVILSLEDLRFQFSREKAFELIEGYSLYDDPLTFVRELIQNSLDALKMQLWHDIKNDSLVQSWIPPEKRDCLDALAPFDFTDNQALYDRYKIDITVRYDEDKQTARIEFADNGIGIIQQDIKEKILRTGASWSGLTYQKQLQEMPGWLRPTGSFGIGLHSVFAVTNQFRIESCSPKEDAGNVILLHSGKGNGFVFSRTDASIERGTRVILEEVDVNRFLGIEAEDSPYYAQIENPVVERLRYYIEENVISPLFNVNLIDGGTGKIDLSIPCLSNHKVYGHLFDPDMRNRLFNGISLSDVCIKQGYDFALTAYRPLCFAMWDRRQQAMYELKPRVRGVLTSERFIWELVPIDWRHYQNGISFKHIAYMGIELSETDLPMPTMGSIMGRLVFNADFLAGEGKRDITANRKQLKQEKLRKFKADLEQSAKACAMFGRELLTAVVQTNAPRRLLERTIKTATDFWDCPTEFDLCRIHTDWDYIFQGERPTTADKTIYALLVTQSFFAKKLPDINQIIKLCCVFQQAVGEWFVVMAASGQLWTLGKNATKLKENKEFHNELNLALVSKFGEAVEHFLERGHDFFDDVPHDTQSNKYVRNLLERHRDEWRKPSVESSIDLLCNTDWIWILWLSHYEGLPVRSILQDADAYFSRLPGFNYGYGFEKCNTLADLLCHSQITCPVDNINYKLFEIAPFLYAMSWQRIDWNDQTKTFDVAWIRSDYQRPIPVEAEKATIQRWWREKRLSGKHLRSPCFEPYAKLGVPGDGIDFQRDAIVGVFGVDRFEGQLVLIFPADVDGTEFQDFLQQTSNLDQAVAGIMRCEQVQHIIGYIHRHQLNKDMPCTRGEIRAEYERLMRDYVEAVRD